MCGTTSFVPKYTRQRGFKMSCAGVLPVPSSVCWDRTSYKIRSTRFLLFLVTGLAFPDFFVMLRGNIIDKLKKEVSDVTSGCGGLGLFWICHCCASAPGKQGSSIRNLQVSTDIHPSSPSALKSCTSQIKAFLQHHLVLWGGYCNSLFGGTCVQDFHYHQRCLVGCWGHQDDLVLRQ